MSSTSSHDKQYIRRKSAKKKKPKKPPESLQEFFGPTGPLASSLDGFETRDEQIEVALAIEDAMRTGSPCLAEAGTGVGKTMAYLVPAVRAALKGKKTVISTHTISLQNQLVARDIPQALQLFPGASEKLTFTVMKGRGNFLCKVALDNARTDIFLTNDPQFKRVQTWAARPECTGDVADLGFTFPSWHELVSVPETCPAKDCPLYEECHFYDMRRSATLSDIIVVNHSLFFSDLKVRLEDPDARILPDVSNVVFDEAHHLEDIATKTFGVEFSSKHITMLVDKIKRIKGADIDTDRLHSLTELNLRLFFPFQQSSKTEFTFAEALPGEQRTASEDVAGHICAALTELGIHLHDLADKDEDLKERLTGLAKMCEQSRQNLTRLFFEPDENAIRWGEAAGLVRLRTPDSRVALHLTPVDITASLTKALWDKMDERDASVIMLSATLANSGGFSYVRGRLGVPDSAIECIVGSPFDFKHQAMLYVPAHLPEPSPAPEYADLLAEEMTKIIQLTEGRAFLLFTSRTMMNTVHAKLDGNVPYPLYKQGDLPPGKLVDEFRKSGNGCLLGLQTFWEGVDIRGDALSCVIIDRLPFAVPDSPITKARTKAISDAGGDWFKDYSIPMAQIRLKQGFGRLIRTHSDTGIVCIMDSRILTRSYGAEFVKHLPQASRASKWNRVERFYKENVEPTTLKAGTSSTPKTPSKTSVKSSAATITNSKRATPSDRVSENVEMDYDSGPSC